MMAGYDGYKVALGSTWSPSCTWLSQGSYPLSWDWLKSEILLLMAQPRDLVSSGSLEGLKRERAVFLPPWRRVYSHVRTG